MADYPIDKEEDDKQSTCKDEEVLCLQSLELNRMTDALVDWVVLYMAGADQLVCIGLGLTLGSLLVWGTFHLNNKYGEHGLIKLLATKSHPRYILNRRKTNRMFKHKKKEE